MHIAPHLQITVRYCQYTPCPLKNIDGKDTSTSRGPRRRTILILILTCTDPNQLHFRCPDFRDPWRHGQDHHAGRTRRGRSLRCIGYRVALAEALVQRGPQCGHLERKVGWDRAWGIRI